MFRGNPSLTGLATGSLENKLSLLWTFKTEKPVKSSPAVVGDRVYVGSDDGRLYAIDFNKGTKVWDFKTEGTVESSPLVLGNRVYVGASDTYLYAIDAANGKPVWKYQTGDKILGAPNWFEEGGTQHILIGSYDFKLYSVDATTGKSNWVYESGNYINGSPAIANKQTIFGGCDAILHVISLKDGQQVKEIDAGAYIAASVALVDQFAYIGHYENAFLCIDLDKGTNVWTYRDRQFPYFSSPAVSGERVLFGGRDKQLHCLNRHTGASLWKFPTRGKVDSSPAVCGDKVVVGSDDGRIYLVALNTGKELWSYEIGQPVGSSPAVANGKVVVGCDDGSVYCFGVKNRK